MKFQWKNLFNIEISSSINEYKNLLLNLIIINHI